MTAAMFASLTDSERRELAARLRRAGERLGDEANLLSLAAPSVLAAYRLPREGYHDFYSAAIECSMLSVEVWKRPERKLLHLNRHDLAVLANAGDAEALAEWEARERGGDPLPAPRLVPTGTGWPL